MAPPRPPPAPVREPDCAFSPLADAPAAHPPLRPTSATARTQRPGGGAWPPLAPMAPAAAALARRRGSEIRPGLLRSLSTRMARFPESGFAPERAVEPDSSWAGQPAHRAAPAPLPPCALLTPQSGRGGGGGDVQLAARPGGGAAQAPLVAPVPVARNVTQRFGLRKVPLPGQASDVAAAAPDAAPPPGAVRAAPDAAPRSGGALAKSTSRLRRADIIAAAETDEAPATVPEED
jgi:hypothetical protein